MPIWERMGREGEGEGEKRIEMGESEEMGRDERELRDRGGTREKGRMCHTEESKERL